MDSLPRVAIISSLTGGLGHYCAHLVGPLSKYVQPKFITYPQVDLSGVVVNQITDSFIAHYIKWPRFDLDDTNPNRIVDIYEYLDQKAIHTVNIHVATTVKRKIEYFTTFVLYGKHNKRTKFVFTLHDVLPFDDDRRLIKLLQMFYGLADAFIVGNELEKEKLIKYFNIPAHKIRIIHHGIYNLFNKHHYTNESARQYLNIENGKKIILFFGWMRVYKGFEYLIQAVSELAKKRNDFIIYVAAGVKYAEPDEIETYTQEIGKRQIEDKFFLNFNYLNTSDMEAVFKASSFVALPYTHASQSGVLMTAVAFKKPVIITDAFFDKSWVKNKAGLVIKPKNPDELAQAIEKLLDNPVEAKQMGEYGFTYATEHFNWDEIAKQYAEVYAAIQK